eukprot:5691527-Amphidinium_carterae.1
MTQDVQRLCLPSLVGQRSWSAPCGGCSFHLSRFLSSLESQAGGPRIHHGSAPKQLVQTNVPSTNQHRCTRRSLSRHQRPV